jgi:hypothetical protein
MAWFTFHQIFNTKTCVNMVCPRVSFDKKTAMILLIVFHWLIFIMEINCVTCGLIEAVCVQSRFNFVFKMLM